MDTIRLDELAMQQLGISRQEADGLIMAGRIFIGEIPADKAGYAGAGGYGAHAAGKGEKIRQPLRL